MLPDASERQINKSHCRSLTHMMTKHINLFFSLCDFYVAQFWPAQSTGTPFFLSINGKGCVYTKKLKY